MLQLSRRPATHRLGIALALATSLDGGAIARAVAPTTLADAAPPPDEQRPLTCTERRQALAPALEAADQLKRGLGTMPRWLVLVQHLVHAQALADMGHRGTPAAEAAHDVLCGAVEALVALHLRQARSHCWTLRAAEIAAIDDALWQAELLAEGCTLAQWHSAEHLAGTATAALVGRLMVHPTAPEPEAMHEQGDDGEGSPL